MIHMLDSRVEKHEYWFPLLLGYDRKFELSFDMHFLLIFGNDLRDLGKFENYITMDLNLRPC